jgi:hypothetical protein
MPLDKPSTAPVASAATKCWRLLAVGLDPDRSTPDFYGLMHEGECDVPLTADGRIVFFVDPARALALIQQHGGALAADPADVAKPTLWCDIAQALHFLSAGGIDTQASVVDAVNVLLDLVKASGAEIDERRRLVLHSIANYCTMSKDITKYLEEEGDYSSDELVNTVLWCVGAVVVMSRML